MCLREVIVLRPELLGHREVGHLFAPFMETTLGLVLGLHSQAGLVHSKDLPNIRAFIWRFGNGEEDDLSGLVRLHTQ